MINICKLKLTILQQEILRLFFIKAGLVLNARAISRYLEVSHPAISKALPLLEKKEFITIHKDKESKRFSIELNRDNPLITGLKRADNLKQLYESGLIQQLYDSLQGATIILFGSYSFGEDTSTSDIDLAVIGIKDKHIDLNKFEKILERNITVNYYKSFGKINKELLNNILNGIVIKGSVDL